MIITKLTESADNQTIKALTPEELAALTSLLEKMEREVYVYNGYKNISGGYAVCEVFDYDDDTIDVELKHGVEGEYHYSEQFEIDRKTMKVIN